MPKHELTKEDRQKAFRAAVLSVQIRYGLEFNAAVQWLLRKGRGLKWNKRN